MSDQVVLSDVDLGDCELGCDPYVVTSLQIGSPAVREVARVRSLADGTFDDTRFVGARAITVALRLRNDDGCIVGGEDMQELVDRVTPYMSPRRRPTLSWKLPGSDQWRATQVRGVQWPFTLESPRFPTLVLQWVSPSGEIFDGDPEGVDRCETITPGVDIEKGRTYDESYVDGGRGPYPDSPPIGARTINNPGNDWSHWVLTIYGAVTNPVFTINDVAIEFNRNGGLVLVTGQNVVINSRERTVLLNGTPTDSRYNRVNFDEWGWDDLRLKPGANLVRFDGTALGPSATAILCYRPTYIG